MKNESAGVSPIGMNPSVIKVTILSVSLLTIMAGAAISPAMGEIAAAFSDVAPILVKLVITLPALLIIPASFLCGRMVERYRKRSLLLVGLLLYLIGGVAGGVAGNIWFLLGCRALLGIGVGFIMPLSTALVSDFYEGAEAAGMMGLISASNCVGAIVSQIVAGLLAVISWRYAFGTYLLGLVAIFMVLVFLPEPARRIAGGGKRKMPRQVWLVAGTIFMVMLCFYAVPVNLAMFMKQEQLGNAASAGLALSVMNISGLLAGLLFSCVRRWLKGFTFSVHLGVFALGFALLYAANSLSLVMGGVFLVGFGNGMIFPLILATVSSSVSRDLNVRAMAIVSSMLYLGQFLSPLVLDNAGKLVAAPSTRLSFGLVSVAMGIAGLAIFSYRIADTMRRAPESGEDIVE